MQRGQGGYGHPVMSCSADSCAGQHVRKSSKWTPDCRPDSPANRWILNASEQPEIDSFLRRRQLPPG